MIEAFLLICITAGFCVYTNFRVTNPFGFLFYFYSLFFSFKIINHRFSGADFLIGVTFEQISKSLSHLLLISASSFLIFILLLKINQQKKIATSPQIALINYNRVIPTLFLFFTFLFFICKKNDLNPFTNPLLLRKELQSSGNYYILSCIIFLNNLFSLMFFYQTFILKKKLNLSLCFCYLSLFTFSLCSGFTSMIIIHLLNPLYFLATFIRKKIEYIIILTMPFVLFGTYIYSVYRDSNIENDSITITESFNIVLQRSDLLSKIFNRFDYLEMFTIANTLYSHNPPKPLNILNFFIQPIPRAFFIDKPLNFSSYSTKLIMPENFDIGVTANFHYINEFLLYLGGYSFFFLPFFYGLIIYITFSAYRATKGNLFLTLKYLLVIFPFFSLGTIAGFINDLALPLLLLHTIYFRFYISRTSR